MGRGDNSYVETIFPVQRYVLQFSFVPGKASSGEGVMQRPCLPVGAA